MVAIRDLIGVIQYHANSDIEAILQKQIARIGDALEYLETGPLSEIKDFKVDKEDPTLSGYEAMKAGSLKTQWEAYIKEKYETAITSLNTKLETYIKDLDDLATKAKVTRSLVKPDKRGTASPNGLLCGQESDKARMKKRIELLKAEYAKNKGKWKSPYSTSPKVS